jgi:hypothetical protein
MRFSARGPETDREQSRQGAPAQPASVLYPLAVRINAYLVRWLCREHKRLRGRRKPQVAWNRAVKQRPRFFAHWAWSTQSLPSGD